VPAPVLPVLRRHARALGAAALLSFAAAFPVLPPFQAMDAALHDHSLRLAVRWAPATAVEPAVLIALDEASLAALRPWVTLLPERTPVNLNTAPREVLAAVIDGIDLGTADRLVQARLGQPFRSLQDDKLPAGLTLDPARVGVRSTYFEVRGRLRLEDRVLDELSLVHKRTPSDVVTRQRQRTASVLPGVPG